MQRLCQAPDVFAAQVNSRAYQSAVHAHVNPPQIAVGIAAGSLVLRVTICKYPPDAKNPFSFLRFPFPGHAES